MKLLIVTHSDLALGLLESFKMIAGKAENIQTLSLTDDGVGIFREKLKNTLDELTSQDQVFILCDLKGGTPYNESYQYYLNNKERVRIVTGVNLPMVLETGLALETKDIDHLQEIALNAGIEGIQPEDKDLEENYELDF